MYHVMFAPNDVRQLSLDQVDDCFRLGLISEETFLWTEGMAKWETLKEAAGLGEPARETPAPRRSPPPSRRAPRAEPPPRRHASKAPRAVSSPEVITSARPLQPSQPARGVAASHRPAAPREATRPVEVATLESAVAQVPHRPNPVSHVSAYPVSQPGWGQQVPAARGPAFPVGQSAFPVGQPHMPAGQPHMPAVNAAHSAPNSGYPVAVPNGYHAAAAGNAFLGQNGSHPTASPFFPATQAFHGNAALQPAATPWPAPATVPPASGVRPTGLATAPTPFNAPSAFTAPLAPVFASVSTDDDDVPFLKGSRRRSSGGGRFRGWIAGLCLVSGALVVAYRNDYLLDFARSAKLESSYLAFERRYLGGAPFGTPREVRGLLGAADSAQVQIFPLKSTSSTLDENKPLTSSRAELARDAPAARVSESARGDDTAAKPNSEAKDSAEAERSPSTQPSRVEESNRTFSSGAVAEKPKTTAPSTPRASKSVSSSPAPRAKVERPSKEPRTKSASSEPMPAPGTDDFLHMSMRQATKKKSSSSGDGAAKKRSSRADYDPLNGEI